jgi:trans-aconitate methyltransferase
MADNNYIHGYSSTEQERLKDQNDVLAKYIYDRCPFKKGRRILEMGCGVGAQMQYLLDHYDPSYLCGVDISAEQIQTAKQTLSCVDSKLFDLVHTDVADFNPTEQFDHLLFVWVLEHVPDPVQLLQDSVKHLKPGATLFITEVNHSSMQVQGASDKFYEIWNAAINFQAQLGGDANIGQRLPEILAACEGLVDVEVKPYAMHFDQSQAAARDELIRYFEPLIESAALPMIEAKYIEESLWSDVKSEIPQLVGNPDVTFYYAFEQGFGKVK